MKIFRTNESKKRNVRILKFSEAGFVTKPPAVIEFTMHY